MAKFEIRKNDKKGDWCPYELWRDDKYFEAFMTYNIAFERMNLYKEIDGFENFKK